MADAAATLGAFVQAARPPAAARARAAAAVLDTVGVTLAGASEPASRIVRDVIADGHGECQILGTALRAGAADAALANGTAAHALDFDDMCFVSLAHPSAPLVPAVLAAAEIAGASGRAVLDAYAIGFEVEARLGRAMNPRHYQRGWHCTSTIGTIGAAAAAARLLGLDAPACGQALAIAASEASGFKENFGSMVKPLHAGLAARNGILAARLAKHGLTASPKAIDGPQGFMAAMDGDATNLSPERLADLGARWEIVETGVTVKLYPSCAGTHPALDTVLDLRGREAFTDADVERIDVDVDSVTPTVLIYDQPASGLEAKFSMPFCVASAIVDGAVGIDTFEALPPIPPRVTALMPRVFMRVNRQFDGVAPPLTQALVKIHLRDGRVLTQAANGARGYPERPASTAELHGKFMTCASRVLGTPAARAALEVLMTLDSVPDVRALMRLLATS